MVAAPRLSGEVGVECVDGHLQHEQPGELRKGDLAQHRAEGDHGGARRESGVDQQRQVQLYEAPAQPQGLIA